MRFGKTEIKELPVNVNFVSEVSWIRFWKDFRLVWQSRAQRRNKGYILDKNLARIPPGVATIDFQYPSFRHRVQGCDTKWNSFQDLYIENSRLQHPAEFLPLILFLKLARSGFESH